MGKKLYVGNLAYSVTDQSLEQLFGQQGTVQSAQVIMDRDTGRSKGFGFVEMGSDAEAQAAIDGLNGKDHGGRSLTVNETGELAKQRVTRLVGELASLIRRVLKIQYEILQGQKGQLEREVIEEQQLQSSGKATEIGNVRVDDEHQYWPFRGEYWRDELGYYRFRLLNRCEKSAPEGAPSGPTGP